MKVSLESNKYDKVKNFNNKFYETYVVNVKNNNFNLNLDNDKLLNNDIDK